MEDVRFKRISKSLMLIERLLRLSRRSMLQCTTLIFLQKEIVQIDNLDLLRLEILLLSMVIDVGLVSTLLCKIDKRRSCAHTNIGSFHLFGIKDESIIDELKEKLYVYNAHKASAGHSCRLRPKIQVHSFALKQSQCQSMTMRKAFIIDNYWSRNPMVLNGEFMYGFFCLCKVEKVIQFLNTLFNRLSMYHQLKISKAFNDERHIHRFCDVSSKFTAPETKVFFFLFEKNFKNCQLFMSLLCYDRHIIHWQIQF
jgi:hypothetical protein